MPSTDPEISVLLASLAEAFDKKSWHGPNLRVSLRGVTAQLAAWRPGEGRHNIWELTLHAAYWKYVVRRRITGEKRGSFQLKGSNFFPRPTELSEAAWKHDLTILEAEHAALRETIAKIPAAWRKDLVKWRATLFLVRGAAAHDLYHAGQIQLLRRLQS
ncbi:MAG TPA: DinB family protein [Bryobacteraceae bacterium]|nr:DinB family protein [Bryobacteraceae bacterium]